MIVLRSWCWDDEGSGSGSKNCGHPTAALPVGARHPFYQRRNQIREEEKLDEYVEDVSHRFSADEGDTKTNPQTVAEAGERITAMVADAEMVER